MNDYNSLVTDALTEKPQPTEVEQKGAMTADEFDAISMSLDAASVVQQWAKDDGLDKGETSRGRLIGLLLGTVAEDMDGKISPQEQAMFDDLCDYAGQYLSRMGVDSDDIDALWNDFDDESITDRVRDVVLSNMPKDDYAAAEDINHFAFGNGETLDAAYKKVAVVRNGKRTIINRRIAGNVKLSPAQKSALKKARAKAKSSSAARQRAKSMKVREKLGMKDFKRT